MLLVPLSPLLIFGYGPVPGFGIAGGGLAVMATTLVTGAVLFGYIAFGPCLVGFRRVRLHWQPFAEIMRVGAVAALSTLQTSLTVVLTTALVGAAGGPDAVAGYGTGARLEYLLVPLAFGFGGPLVALVGTNIGAGQPARALRIGLIGGALAFALTETVGLAAAIWPQHWLGLFGHDPRMIATGSAYLARGRAGLRLLWPRAGAVFRVARRRQAALAAAVGAAAADHRHRRRLAGAGADRIAAVDVRGADHRADRLWRDDHRRRRHGRLVQAALTAPAWRALAARPCRGSPSW